MSTLTIPVGVTWIYAWPILSQSQQPVDLAGYSARAQIRANKWFWDTLPILHSWISTGATPNITMTNSSVTLYVLPVESRLWRWWSGVLQIELSDPSGRVARVDEWNIALAPEVIW